jgi:hypothetical protein
MPNCPKCSFAVTPPAIDCPRCGVVFARLEDRAGRRSPAVVVTAERIAGPGRIDASVRRTLLTGSLLAALVTAFPLSRFVFGYMGILLHEFGHTVAAWLFGYPAVPAFNFAHGGGLTSIEGRQWPVMLLWIAGVCGLLWRYRHHRPAWPLLALPCALYIALAVTRVHEIVITFMGHGMELTIAGVFLYRALSGSAVKHAVEKPLYAFLGLFLVLGEMNFAWGLATNRTRQIEYGISPSGIPNDWLRIADRLGTDLPTATGAYLLVTPIPVLLAFVFFRYRERIFDAIGSRLRLDLDDTRLPARKRDAVGA